MSQAKHQLTHQILTVAEHKLPPLQEFTTLSCKPTQSKIKGSRVFSWLIELVKDLWTLYCSYTDGSPCSSWTGQKRCRLAGGPCAFSVSPHLLARSPPGLSGRQLAGGEDRRPLEDLPGRVGWRHWGMCGK